LPSVFSSLSDRFRRREEPTWKHLTLATPPEVVYAVGDVHGCYALLRKLEEIILADGAKTSGEKLIVMLGDYVDRGAASADVLDHLLRRPPAGFVRACLVGNHEAMMLDYLANPTRKHIWLGNGGMETLRSYGVPTEALSTQSGRQLRHLLDAYIPPEHLRLLERLNLTVSIRDTVFVHAGFRPGTAPERQSLQDLLWSRPGDYPPATSGLVVHGHTPAADPVVTSHRICVDTGAFATGRLSAVRLVQGCPPVILSAGG
jgi:serine/threonine protein phosphatase 1